MKKEIEEILKCIDDMVKPNDVWDKVMDYITNLQEKLNKIDKLINTDYGWVSYYYKYNNRYFKSEIKEDINKILGDE